MLLISAPPCQGPVRVPTRLHTHTENDALAHVHYPKAHVAGTHVHGDAKLESGAPPRRGARRAC
jgi:hypothetical protein